MGIGKVGHEFILHDIIHVCHVNGMPESIHNISVSQCLFLVIAAQYQ